MDCKRQEAKRLGTGLQIRVSGFDSRLAVHFCGRKTTSLKQKTSHHATTGNHPTTLRRPHEVRRVFILPTVISGSLMPTTFMPVVLCDKIPLSTDGSLCTHIVPVQYSLTSLI